MLCSAILCHSSASVALAYFVFDSWDCELYWPVFALCSGLPALTELCAIIGVSGLKRGW